MGIISWLARAFDRGLGTEELARRLGLAEEELAAVRPSYRRFSIEKRGGGRRWIDAPDRELKSLQRRILRRLLAALEAHPSATGFERGRSIVTNAARHAGRPVLLRLDIVEFFASTRAERVKAYFRRLGWSRRATALLVELVTHEGSLPQGAPTSPRLSNLLNRGLDARLAGLAKRRRAVYTRYADDITFSFADDDPRALGAVIGAVRRILGEHGYRLHRAKLRVLRRHQAQVVTGLVVNRGVNLPRRTRRWLRAVEHRARNGGSPSIGESQRRGWVSLVRMVEVQRPAGGV